MAVKLQLTVSDEAWKVIEDAATERKRGDWLSAAIVDYKRILDAIPTDGAGDGAGVLESIDSRLSRLEKSIAAMTLLLQDKQGK